MAGPQHILYGGMIASLIDCHSVCTITLRARIRDIAGRKTTVTCSVWSTGEERVRGEVVAVRVPLEWLATS